MNLKKSCLSHGRYTLCVGSTVAVLLFAAGCGSVSDSTAECAASDPAAAPTADTPTAETPSAAAAEVPPALAFTMTSIDGKPVELSRYLGKVILVVNVASKCGFTRQYEGLEKLHEEYAGKGLAILGFPANNFGAQEPGTDEEIRQFCTATYGVRFDMFSKISVRGDDIHPLYRYLTSDAVAVEDRGDVKWNFEKFLIDRTGKVVGRYRSPVTPAELAPDIRKALGQG